MKSLDRQAADDPYLSLGYSQIELQEAMRVHYAKIIDFIASQPFRLILAEMSELSSSDRPKFVVDVLLDHKVLEERGVQIPPGILIQRSAFGDRRPTLFAVKHFLPEKFRNGWENVNITFDNVYLDSDVSRNIEDCWRAPPDPAQLAQAIYANQDLSKI